MRYIDQSLASGETVIQRGKWPVLFWIGAWLALLILGIAIVGVFIFVVAAVHMLTTDFAVTNRRVVIKRGLITRRTQELAVESVEGVSLQQSLLARLFGYGRVIVTGTGEATIVFPPMAHPVAFRRAIEAARADCGEVRVVREERVASEEGVRGGANENEREEAVEEAPPRRKRHPSFIGLRARR
ncbi:MAG: PH domain-containing protein [Hyphomonadaceae bacterium]